MPVIIVGSQIKVGSPIFELSPVSYFADAQAALHTMGSRRSLWLLSGCAPLLSCLNLSAQEMLFESTQRQRVTEQTRTAIELMPYTFRVKDLRVMATPTLGIEWNDNVYTSDANKEQDVLFSPYLDFHAVHPLGPRNRISLDLGIGYTKYVDHTDLDRLLIVPGSVVDFDFGVGDVEFNLHDRFTYQLDPTLVGAVAGVGSFGGLNNTAGFLVSWQLHRVDLTAGYDYVRFIAESSEQSHLDRSTHGALTKAGFEVYPGMVLGAEVTASPTTYDDSFLNDNTGYSVGGYADWKASEVLHVIPRGGYSLTTFSSSSVAPNVPDYTGFYFGLELDHRPNETVTYRVSADRQIRPGVDANLTDTYNVMLGATWSLIERLPLTGSIYYEDGKQAGGGLTENWERVGGSIGLSKGLTERLRVALSYGLTYRNSDLAGRDYLQNHVTLTLAYRL